MRVVADSHALYWYLQGSDRLSEPAREALTEAWSTDGIFVAVATILDLWYVSQTTRSLTPEDVEHVRTRLGVLAKVTLEPVTAEIADAMTSFPRAVLLDPWDRLIVATARVLSVPLVTRDDSTRGAQLVQTIW